MGIHLSLYNKSRVSQLCVYLKSLDIGVFLIQWYVNLKLIKALCLILQ